LTLHFPATVCVALTTLVATQIRIWTYTCAPIEWKSPRRLLIGVEGLVRGPARKSTQVTVKVCVQNVGGKF
jgi:hypothetical protein